MTNSHNRTMGGRNSERNNASPHQYTGSYYGSSSRKIKGQKSPSSNKFFTSSISPTNSLSSSPPKFHGRPSENGRPNNAAAAAHPIHFNNHQNHHQYNNNNNNNSSNNNNNTSSNISTSASTIARPQQHYGSSPGGLSASPSSLASSPPNITLFAGSKCYDAPSPTALPRPPRHWTLCSVAASRSMTTKSGSDFSDNLKLLLNVRA